MASIEDLLATLSSNDAIRKRRSLLIRAAIVIVLEGVLLAIVLAPPAGSRGPPVFVFLAFMLLLPLILASRWSPAWEDREIWGRLMAPVAARSVDVCRSRLGGTVTRFDNDVYLWSFPLPEGGHFQLAFALFLGGDGSTLAPDASRAAEWFAQHKGYRFQLIAGSRPRTAEPDSMLEEVRGALGAVNSGLYRRDRNPNARPEPGAPERKVFADFSLAPDREGLRLDWDWAGIGQRVSASLNMVKELLLDSAVAAPMAALEPH